MTERSHLMDGLRVLAAHLIVLHHLVTNGPLGQTLQPLWPGLFQLLHDHGRYATQVFLVMAGYLSGLALLGPQPPTVVRNIGKRYARLMPAYLLAILMVALVVTCLRPWINQDWLTEPPTLQQWLSHALLIQSLIDQPAMTVGAWYVAIDFQLFVVLNVLVWGLFRLGLKQGSVLMALAVLCLASQWVFNRNPDGDVWALYFFESYGLGAVLAHTMHDPRGNVPARGVLLLCMCSAVVAGFIYPRPRLLISVAVCGLLWWGVYRWHPPAALSRWLQRQSDASYSLFVTHFIPLVVANALWISWDGQSTAWGVVWLLVTWGVCVGWSVIFYHTVETLTRKAWRH